MNLESSKPIAALITCLLGCAPLAQSEARIDRANQIPRVQCEDALPAERAARVLGTRGMLGVAPITTAFRTAKGYETSRPGGVEIRYAAPQGVTAAWFQRQLECHQADVALGRVAARADDPFVLPDAWLSLDVSAVGSALVVRVSADDRDAAGALVERAQRLQRAQAR